MSRIEEKFGNRLREIRKDIGLSQQELSRKAGFDRTYVGKIERAEKSPSLKAIQKIAWELDIKVKKLFEFD